MRLNNVTKFSVLFLSLLVWSCQKQTYFAPVETEDIFAPQPDSWETEDFDQKASTGKVDILFIDDNSSSMYEDQQKLGARISKFLQKLDGIDWRVGITTTDISDGFHGLKGTLSPFANGAKYIAPTTSNYEALFLQNIVRKETISCNPECPTSDEQPLRAMMLAVQKKDTNNAGFFRADADLVTVTISDEDEMSIGPDYATKPAEVVATVLGVLGIQKRFTAYGIIIQPGDTACYNDQSLEDVASYGLAVKGLSLLTGGLTGSICDNDYSTTLSKMGTHLRTLISAFELKHNVDAENIKVFITPQQDIKWRVEGRKLTFDHAPAEGSKIRVVYKAKK